MYTNGNSLIPIKFICIKSANSTVRSLWITALLSHNFINFDA